MLSAFGLVPSALVGVDVSVLLDNASDAKSAFLKDPSLVVDIAYLLAYHADQYLSYTDDGSSMPGLSDWAEQLVAESTGKNQVGRLPVVIEKAATSPNVFSIAYAGSADLVVEADLASQFIVWEWVTALVGAALEIDPFNQPNVTEAKGQTSSLLQEWSGLLPTFTALHTDGAVEIFGDGEDVAKALRAFIQGVHSDAVSYTHLTLPTICSV